MNRYQLTAAAAAVVFAATSMSVGAAGTPTAPHAGPAFEAAHAAPQQVTSGDALITESASGGLIGYFSAPNASPGAGFGSGYSWYSSVWPVLDEPIANFQLGLGSSWLYPQLGGDSSHYCDKADSFAKDLGAPDMQLFFQTIEGGLGYWTSTQFLSQMPKYRINTTPNCYEDQIASPGWNFGSTTGLQMDQTGIVQLSNRLLIPPDGLTFPYDPTARLLGSAWMKVPLAPARQPGLDPVPTGNNFWTLFLNSTNFKGPVASILPQRWADLSRIDPAIVGKGFDANPMIKHPDMAAEIGQVPMFESTTAGGTYTRVPALSFPVDANQRTVITQDVRAYSDAAFVDAFDAWSSGGPTPPSIDPSGSTTLAFSNPPPAPQIKQGANGSSPQPITGLESVVSMSSFDAGAAFGFSWSTAAPGSVAQLPQYYQASANSRTPLATAPPASGLEQQTFPQPPLRQITYGPPDPEWWNIDPGAPRGVAALSDGSVVTYAWVRFVDQPAIRRLGLTAQESNNLQTTVANLHNTWPTNTDYIPPPSSGSLATLDPALLVTPPAGLTAGYVPIVLSQTGMNRASSAPFVPLTPSRILNTRGGAKVGNAAGTGAAYVLKVTGAGGVPTSGVAAVALNVTVTQSENPTIGGGFVTVYPCDKPRPDASNLNFVTDQTVPNSVIAPVSANGEVCFYVYGTTHLLADVSGYFPSGAGFNALTPARIMNTRGGAKVGNAAGTGVPYVLKVTGAGGVPTSGVAAVVLNVTVTQSENPTIGGGFVTVYPCDQPRPDASNLNFVTDQTVPNSVIAPVSANGEVCFYVYGTTHLLADVSGYLATGAGFNALTPSRIMNTRGGAKVGNAAGTGAPYVLKVTGAGGVPASGVAAVALNVTVTQSENPTIGGGFVTVYPCDKPRPDASNLNFVTDQTVPNSVIAPVSANGEVCFYVYGTTHLLADVSGYFPT